MAKATARPVQVELTEAQYLVLLKYATKRSGVSARLMATEESERKGTRVRYLFTGFPLRVDPHGRGAHVGSLIRSSARAAARCHRHRRGSYSPSPRPWVSSTLAETAPPSTSLLPVA